VINKGIPKSHEVRNALYDVIKTLIILRITVGTSDLMTMALQTRVKNGNTSSLTAVPMLQLQRKCDKFRKKKGLLQRSSTEQARPSAVPSIVHDVLNSPGQALDSETNAFFEPRLGHDFSKVRVHTDAQAEESARSINAYAYAVGKNIVFGHNQYSPETENGKKLIAHELIHVLQQSKGPISSGSIDKLSISDPNEESEQEAEIAAEQLITGNYEINGNIYPKCNFNPHLVNIKLHRDDINNPSGQSQPSIDMGNVEDWPDYVADPSDPGQTQSSIDLGNVEDWPEYAMIKLSKPPDIRQSNSMDCWAAASASWLRVTGIDPNSTREGLIEQFGACLLPDGSIDIDDWIDVFAEIGVDLIPINPRLWDYNMLKRYIETGHVLLITGSSSLYHTLVAYEVGVDPQGNPNLDYYSAFDPYGEYKQLSFSNNSPAVYIGVSRGSAGPRAKCH
jgi:hypothetical protein